MRILAGLETPKFVGGGRSRQWPLDPTLLVEGDSQNLSEAGVLTEGCGWSPDGKKIAFHAIIPGPAEGDLRKALKRAIAEGDSKKILEKQRKLLAEQDEEVYVINADGTGGRSARGHIRHRSGSWPKGAADVASIDSNVLEILLEQTSALREKVRVLESWGPYPIQPVVVRADLDPALKVALRESLLSTEDEPLTRSKLEAFGVKRFVAVDEEDYEAGGLPQPSVGR
jgi:hypothetical protein